MLCIKDILCILRGKDVLFVIHEGLSRMLINDNDVLSQLCYLLLSYLPKDTKSLSTGSK